MHDEDEGWLRRLDGRGFALVLAAALMAWMFVIGIVSAMVAMVVVVAGGGEPSTDALYRVLYLPAVLGPVTLVQMGGIAGIVALLTHLRGGGWRRRLALGRPPAWMLVLALFAGASIGPFAGFVAQEAERIFEPLGIFSSAHLVEMARALVDGPLLMRLPLLLAVLIGAPLVEELVFRGLLWSVLEEHLSPRVVWLITSLGFAAYHMDPLHSVAILATAFVLGWLRLASGSLWPGVLAHFANNVNGVAWIFVLGPEDQTSMTGGLAVACLTVAVASCALLLLGRRDPPSSG